MCSAQVYIALFELQAATQTSTWRRSGVVGSANLACGIKSILEVDGFLCSRQTIAHRPHDLALSQPCCVFQVQATSRHRQHTASLVTPRPMCLALGSSLHHTHPTPHSRLPTRPHLLTHCHPPTLPQHHLPCLHQHIPLQCPPHHTPFQWAPRRTHLPAVSDRVPLQLQHWCPRLSLLDSTCRLCHLMVKVRAALSRGHPSSTPQTSTHSSVSSRLSSMGSTAVSSILQQARVALLSMSGSSSSSH